MTKKINNHIKVGDRVKVIAGSQKGFLGLISSIIKKKSLVVIEGILPRVKYLKNSENGESKKKELPYFLHISNIMLWDKKTNSSSRIGYKIITGKKSRYFKKSGNLVD
jgi:large subunit ribosomal protein L24